MTIQTMFNNFPAIKLASSPDKGRMAGFYLQKVLQVAFKTGIISDPALLTAVTKALTVSATTKNT